MPKIFFIFLLFINVSSQAFAEKTKQQYLECLSALGVQDPVYKGTRKQMNEKVLEQVKTTQGEMESYLNLPDFSEPAQEVLRKSGASLEFERDFTKALVAALPSLIQANSKNLETFTKLTKEFCRGFDPAVDALLTELEPQFQNLVRLNAKVEKKVVDEVERRIGFELFHPAEGEKPFPWKDPESANLRIRGYLEKKLERARQAITTRGGRAKPGVGKSDTGENDIHR
jgi:hypothetical protein